MLLNHRVISDRADVCETAGVESSNMAHNKIVQPNNGNGNHHRENNASLRCGDPNIVAELYIINLSWEGACYNLRDFVYTSCQHLHYNSMVHECYTSHSLHGLKGDRIIRQPLYSELQALVKIIYEPCQK